MTGTVPKSGRHRAALHLQDAADAELLAAVRAGDTAAFGVLYHRHQAAARRLAGVLVRDPSDAEDLVAEAMTRVLAALRTGRGPSEAFRAYLLTAVRHVCYDRARRDRRIELTDDFSQYVDRETADPTVARLERSYAARAFARLPERWRLVLWHTEVEGERPAAIAPLLGLTPTAVAALAYRAREGLRQLYLQEHLADTDQPACRWTASRLAAHVRGRLPRRDRAKVDTHLASCERCRALCAELAEVNAGLRGVLGPIVLGTAAGPYLAAVPPAAWWAAVAGGVQNAAAAVHGWVRGLVDRYGPHNVAAGAGLAAAGLVGLLLFVLSMALAPDPPRRPQPPEPPPVAEPHRPIPAPVPAPSSPRPTTSPPTPTDPAPAMPTVDEPASPSPSRTPPAQIAVSPNLSATSLAAGSTGTLAISVAQPGDRQEVLVLERAQVAPVRVTVGWPDRMALAGSDGGDGWRCAATGTGAECRRPGWPAGESRTVRVPVAVDGGLAGFAPVRVTVAAAGQRGAAEFRVPVAPLGMRVGYAAGGRQRVAMAGNTWLSCPDRPACLDQEELDNNRVALRPYLPNPPAGLDPAAVAASGVALDLPPGAEPAWAGLFWAATSGSGPDRVLLHNGADWFSIRQQGQAIGAALPLRQAYADVTELIRGPGTFWVATTAPLPTGRNVSAGWSLAVAYRHPDAPRRDLAVFVDPVPVSTESAVQVTAGGATEVGLVLWEGDRHLTGDTLAIDGQALTGNAGNAQASGALEPDWHTFGVDVARYRGTGTSVTLHTGRDRLWLGVLVLASKVPAAPVE